MPTFYKGQKDYIDKLNELDTGVTGSAQAAEDSNLEAEDWANKTSGVVNTYTAGVENADGTEYSAKYYANASSSSASSASTSATSASNSSTSAATSASTAATHAANAAATANYLGTWNSATTYAVGDSVHYDDAIWLSNVASNLNSTPSSSNTDWQRFSQVEFLSAINKSLGGGTIVANFIYDTSNDYNPNWVDEANHQSWYHETLNTSTRGATKKFPRVAGIVAESNKVTIYDLTQASCPMWRVFSGDTGRVVYEDKVSSVYMKNGVLYVGADTVGGLGIIDFINDYAYLMINATVGYNGSNIADTNLGSSDTATETLTAGLVNRNINDIAATQDNTGNNIVAVATDGGVSVIKADGSVVDITETTGNSNVRYVTFRSDGKLGFGWGDSTDGTKTYFHVAYLDIPTSDISAGYYYQLTDSTPGWEDYTYVTGGNDWEGPVITPDADYSVTGNCFIANKIGFSTGLTHLKENTDTPANGLVAYQTANYNTGYLAGDIKGSFMNEAGTTADTIGIPYEIMTTASDAEASDYYGSAVALSEDGLVMAVGAIFEDTTASAAGKVYTYKRDTLGDNWSEVTTTQASDAANGDSFGSFVGLSSDGLVMSVGAYEEDTTATGAGKVYTFKRSTISDAWTEVTTTQASDIEASDRFGISCSLSGDGLTLVVGTDLEDTSYLDSGKVYSYTRADIDSAWTEQNMLQASDIQASDGFGFSCALSGDGLILAVGSFLEDTAASTAGKVYTYSRQSTTDEWSNESMLVASNAGADDSFGTSVALSSDGLTLAVGAYKEDTTATDAGIVYLYRRTDLNSNWVEQLTLQSSDITANDRFGYATSLANNGLSLSVGTPYENTAASLAGKVYTYHLGTGNLVSNGTFDLASGWTLNSATAAVSSGEFEITTSASSHAVLQSFPVISGETYQATWDARCGTMTGLSYSVYDVTNATNIIAPTSYTSSTTMSTYTVTFTVPNDCTRINFYPVRDSGNTGTAFVDNIKVIPLTLSGGNLVTNGTFDTDTAWTYNATYWTISSGVASNSGFGGALYLTQEIPNLIVGNTYMITYSIPTLTSGAVGGYANNTADWNAGSSGTYQSVFTATSEQTVGIVTNGFIGTIDNISVQPIERAEHVINGGFDTDSDWTKSDGTWTITGNQAVATSATNTSIYQLNALDLGVTYVITLDVGSVTAGTVDFGTGAGLERYSGISQAGVYTLEITTVANDDIYIVGRSGFTGTINSISVKQSQNLVSNGTFHTDTTGWTGTNATLSVSSGQLVSTVVANGISRAHTTFSSEVGKKYLLTLDFIAETVTGNTFIYVGTASGNASLANVNMFSTTGSYVVEFTATGFITYVSLSTSGSALAGETITFDNISVVPLNNQVANGDFSLGLHGWTGSNATLIHDNTTYTNGMQIDSTTTGGICYTTISTSVGETYILNIKGKGTATAHLALEVGTSIGADDLVTVELIGSLATEGHESHSFTATGNTTYISLGPTGTGAQTCYVDNISVYPAYLDRSVNANNLQIHGQLDVTPVAAGSDSLAVSGFSNQNFLQQPYNSALDFGTGDFFVMGWFKFNTLAGTNAVLDRTTGWLTDGFAILADASNYIFTITNTRIDIATAPSTTNYNHIVMARSSGILYLYLNGVLENSGAAAGNVDISTILRLGYNPSCAFRDSSLSRFRIGAGAPTAEDIEYIYNQEKYLYQDNSTSVLQGVSSNIQAMDYDESTDLLTVCSEDYLNRIQGLRVVESESYGVGSELVTQATLSLTSRLSSYTYSNGDNTVTVDWNYSTYPTQPGYIKLNLNGLSAGNDYVIEVTQSVAYDFVDGTYLPKVYNASGLALDIATDFEVISTKSYLLKFTADSGPSLFLYGGVKSGAITYTLSIKEILTSISTRNGYEIRGN